MKKKVKNQKKAKNKFFEKAFNNPHIIFAVMSIIMLFLIGYTRYIVHSHAVYTFEGESGDVAIYDGLIDLNRDVNYFVSGKIAYNGEDIKLKSYEMGYYICNKKNNIPLATETNEDEKGKLSLNNVLTYSLFSFTEVTHGGNIFTKKNKENLDNLCFILNGKDANDKEINILVKLKVNKM